MARLTLLFFGSFHAALSDSPLTQLRSARIQALLAYLVLEAEQPHSRDALAGLFWPDVPESVAKQNLRQALYQLRQLLEEQAESTTETPPFLLLTRETVQFNRASDYTLDVTTFLTCLERQQVKEALDLYRGDLLPDLTSDSPFFEEWLTLWRERLHLRALDALDGLAQRALEEGDFLQAQRFARHQIALEPWRERAHRQLMLALARSGERSAALAQFGVVRRILAEELEVEPDAETNRLVEQIRLGRVAIGATQQGDKQVSEVVEKQAQGAEGELSEQKLEDQSPQVVQPRLHLVDWGEAPNIGTLFGRANELATMQHWIMDEHCRLVTLLGMGGIGKTTLTISLTRQLTQHFNVVIWRSLLNAPPLNEILDSWLTLFAGQQFATSLRSLDAKLNSLFHHLRNQRCLLVLDNAESIMQVGERAGLYRPGAEEYGQLFKRMGETSHQSVLLVTSREQPLEVARLARETPLVRLLVVEGLTTDAGKAILRQQGVSDSTAHANQLIQRYSGNPLALMLVAETIEELYAGDLEAFLEDETPIFDDIRDVLDQQFARLPLLERNVLLWLAIEREPITIQQLSDNFHNLIPKHLLVEALNSLRRRSLLERTTNAQDDVPSKGGFTLQNVVTEYLIEHIIEGVCKEIKQCKPVLLKSHALLRAQANEYVRQSQMRLILQPIGERLLATLGAPTLETRFSDLLNELRLENDRLTTYAGGNLLNLLLCMGANLQAMDFSRLAIWQAFLQDTFLPALNLTESDLSGCTFTDTFGAISSVGLSPTHSVIAAGTTNGEIRLWRSVDGQSLGILEGHTNFVFSTLFSPNGRTLYSCGDDEMIRVWDIQSLVNGGSQHASLLQTVHEHRRGVWRLSLSADGRHLASASGDHTVCLWAVDEQNGSVQLLHTLQGHSQGVRAVAFHPDGKVLASGSNDSVIRLWHVQSGEVLALLVGHTDAVLSLAFSPDGHLLASGSDDRTLRLWNLSTLMPLAMPQSGAREIYGEKVSKILYGHSGPVTAIAFRNDGKLLASGSNDHNIRLWEVERGVVFQTLHGHQDEVTSVIFDAMGTMLASSSMDRTIRLWEPQHGQALRTLQGHVQGVMAVAFSPTGKFLATACQDHQVRLWDWQNNQPLRTLQGHDKEVLSVAFSPDGNTLASSSIDQTIRLWDMRNGSPISVLRGHQRWIRGVAFSPDGNLIASCSNDWTIRLWDVHSGTLQQTLKSSDSVWSISFSPDGQTLASAGTGRVVHLWNRKTGTIFMTLHGHLNWITSLAFSPDGLILASGSADQTVRLWNAKSGELLDTLYGHSAWVYGVAFSPDGARLATAGADRTVRLWQTEGGKELQILRGHANEIRSIAFSPDGEILASGSMDETVRLWQVQSATSLTTLRAPRPYEGMKIDGVTGITEAQRFALKVLGAVEQA